VTPLAATRATQRRANRVALPTPAPSVVRCAIYTRQSVEDRTGSGFTSLQAQKESALAYIAALKSQGWEPIDTDYTDSGFSGGNIERPALTRLLTDVEDGLIDAICVYRLDRLSRSLRDLLNMLEFFEQHDVSFVSVTEQLNTATPAGRLMMSIVGGMAEYEKSVNSARVSDKMCAARRKGKYQGGPAVLGYTVDREKKRLIVDPEEAAMVRELFELYLQHASLMKVSQIAHKRGWTTKSWTRKDGTKREGGSFDKAKLQRILTSVTYTGQVQHKGEILPGEHEAIIDQDVFDRVQALIRENGNGSGGIARNKHSAILRGILRCGACGAAMSHHYTQKGTRLYRYYRCVTSVKRGKAACPTPSLPAHEIEDFVVEQIKRLARDPELVRSVFEEASRQQQASIPCLKAERTRIQRERQHQGQEIRRLVAAVAAADKPPPSLNERLSQLEESVGVIDRRLGEIDSELAAVEQSSIDSGHVAATLSEFNQLWDVLYPQEKTRIVHLLVERVVYSRDQDGIQLVFHPDGLGTLGTETRTACLSN